MTMLKLVLLFFLILFVYFVLSFPYYSGDVKNHVVWAKSILDFGPFGLYNRYFHDFAYPNYPPLAMFAFTLSLVIYKLVYLLIWFLNITFTIFPSNFVITFESWNMQAAFLKLPALVSTIGLTFMLYKLAIKLKKVKKWISLICIMFLVNPAIFYLSVIWGQVDILPTFFLSSAFYFLLEKKLFLSSLLIAFSLLSKQTSIIFWPIFLLFAAKIYDFKTVFISFLVTFLAVYLFYIPFLGFSITDLISLYISNFDYVAKVTQVNSINLWGFLFDFASVDDRKDFLGLTYNGIGFLFFSLSIIPIMISLFVKKFKNIFDSFYIFNYALFLISIFYFLFLTRMHERYLIPAVIFSYILIIFRKFHVLNLLFFSLLVFINLYRGLEIPNIYGLRTLIFSIPFLGILFMCYLLISIYNYILFFRTLRKI